MSRYLRSLVPVGECWSSLETLFTGDLSAFGVVVTVGQSAAPPAGVEEQPSFRSNLFGSQSKHLLSLAKTSHSFYLPKPHHHHTTLGFALLYCSLLASVGFGSLSGIQSQLPKHYTHTSQHCQILRTPSLLTCRMFGRDGSSERGSGFNRKHRFLSVLIENSPTL